MPYQPHFATDPEVAEYYARAPEEERLEQGAFVLEELRTRELIVRFAPRPPATVLDVGGAAGAYALWLADAGYTVHLVDAAPRLVAEAERRSAGRKHRLASCRVGDARALEVAADSTDVVLLLGPLYHLTEARDRARALEEAFRVLKPEGRLYAAGISRWASVLDGLSRDLLQDPEFSAIVERDVREGQHRNPTGRLEYFTTAYFHRPDELRAEILEAGFSFEGMYGLEGPGWFLTDIEARIADPRRLTDLLRAARLLEAEPSLLGISAHLLAVARKPQGRSERGEA
ncbi:MAG TPA: methyltransferase domain-containing protein [Gemmatimonadales bacterium]|nr:methyltransferase domain-containing protein [Gemmatimonadales bacterium]